MASAAGTVAMGTLGRGGKLVSPNSRVGDGLLGEFYRADRVSA